MALPFRFAVLLRIFPKTASTYALVFTFLGHSDSQPKVSFTRKKNQGDVALNI